MNWLPVLHRQQSQSSDCLAACTAMVFDYLQVPYRYEQLLKLLRVRSFGTMFSNLRYLDSFGLSILIERGDVSALRHHLESGLPPIVFVNTGFLSHWDETTGHAVIVVALEDRLVYVNDPKFVDAPKAIPLTEFEAAWIEQEQLYAVIGLDSITPFNL